MIGFIHQKCLIFEINDLNNWPTQKQTLSIKYHMAFTKKMRNSFAKSHCLYKDALNC